MTMFILPLTTSAHIYQVLLTAQPTLTSSAVVARQYLSVTAGIVSGICNWASLISVHALSTGWRRNAGLPLQERLHWM